VATAILEIPALPPRSIVFDPPLSDEEFERLCEKTEFAFLERAKDGTIVMNAPAGSSTSDGNGEIYEQLRSWWKKHRKGKAYESSAGFFLPDGSMLNPDASYVTAEQLAGLSREQRDHFLRLAPAFVIELRSPSHRLAGVQQKMEVSIANGVQLGWLIDPSTKQVYVYERGAPPRGESGSHVSGAGPIEGFVLDLEEVWSCYE
jgi:Uma2 family endonuclease